jgi:hypothetical protein
MGVILISFHVTKFVLFSGNRKKRETASCRPLSMLTQSIMSAWTLPQGLPPTPPFNAAVDE